jgi:hypothetical protein
MSFLLVVASSWVSNPVSSSILKIVAYLAEVALMILWMFSVVGIRDTLRSHLYFGFFHVIWFVLQK